MSITEKQISFIARLAAQTGAYQDGEGMAVNGKLYTALDLEAALDGTATKREASHIIDALLAAPKTHKAPANPITPKQFTYITALLEKAGQSRKQADLLEMSSQEASELISELKAA